MAPHCGLRLARPLDDVDPLAALRGLVGLPYPFALHSGGGHARSAWSFCGADPFAVFRGGECERAIGAFRELAARVRADRPAGVATPFPDPPFAGGAVGYWSYDFGRRLERLPSSALDDLGLPDHVLAFYDVVLAFHHPSGSAWILSSGLPCEGDLRRERAEARLAEFAGHLTRSRGATPAPAAISGDCGVQPSFEPPGPRGRIEAASTFTADAYRRGIEVVKEHIRRGDIFQANLSQRWTVTLGPADPAARALALFERLVERAPAPFAAFLGAGDHAIASASPERFFELRENRVETRPIKGTRPRAAEAAEDARLAGELVASEKDRAENVMIVDVLRNDLGRVCEPGSVETPSLCELEAFAQVFHLTSTVTGRLRSGLDAFDLLRACFPGGSITGAPKIRAMEILESLEPVRRHIYTGSLGYVDWSGDADWNIAIRTALVTPAAIRFAAGGGITADSDPDAEYRETLDKAEGMRVALEGLLGSTVDLMPSVTHA